MTIFIIGPGGVGKTTSGKILAKKFGYTFVDLDHEFSMRIENIGRYIEKNGYKKYCYENSTLFYKLLDSLDGKCVFVLSSGFLVHDDLDDLTNKHQNFIKENGLSILLLPSKDIEKSTKIIVNRQMNRGFDLEEISERKKFMKRFFLYQNFGDIKVFSYASPEKIASLMYNALKV